MRSPRPHSGLAAAPTGKMQLSSPAVLHVLWLYPQGFPLGGGTCCDHSMGEWSHRASLAQAEVNRGSGVFLTLLQCVPP